MNKEKRPADGFVEYMSPAVLADLRAGKERPKGEYNPTISPLFKTQSGKSYVTLIIGPEQFDALQKVEIGGKLLFKLKDPSQNTPNTRVNAPRRASAGAPKGRVAKDDLSDL